MDDGGWTHSCSVDGIVQPSELLNDKVNHGLHAVLVGYVDGEVGGLVFGVRGVLLAFFGGGSGCFSVHVGEDDDTGACFGEGEGGLLADATAGLD